MFCNVSTSLSDKERVAFTRQEFVNGEKLNIADNVVCHIQYDNVDVPNLP